MKEKQNIAVVIGSILVFTLVVISFLGDKFIFSNNFDIENDYNRTSVYNVEKSDFDNNINDKENDTYLIEGDFLADNVVTKEEKNAMKHNTRVLQYLVDTANENDIKIPKGIYYFSKGGTSSRGTEDYVIKPKNGITITGAGTDDDNGTILKPYAVPGTIKYGLDMFYWNEFSDSGGSDVNYLENVSFNNFIIDGESVKGNIYNSSGKGFMINLCRNCYWDNIIVKNTDGTGFGMDNVINGKITNSTAINCGKNANIFSEGASGFGIGTGFSDDESMYIENCKSIGNTKFGFFFEHQGRFSKDYTSSKSNGFKVVNSIASGNLYNFGGLRANDVLYNNCSAYNDDTDNDGTPKNYTKLDIYFDDQSRRIEINNFNSEYNFNDVKQNTYYNSVIKWGYDHGIIYGIDKSQFGIGQFVTRAEAITFLWRYAGRPGDVLAGNLLSSNDPRNSNLKIKFKDVSNSSWYVSAVKWGVDSNIINGVSDELFEPNSNVTNTQFITMLWRYAGEPVVNTNAFPGISSQTYYFNAINWAYSKGIISNKLFYPNKDCTREMVTVYIYRYNLTIS